MEKIAIVYSSMHGHVRAIAEHLAAIAALRRVETVLYDVKLTPLRRLPGPCTAVIVVGSVHFGRHAKLLTRFVRHRQPALASMPSAFVSVSGSAASADGQVKAAEYVTDFLEATHWQPDLTLPCAGAIPYTRYGPLTKLVMKFASRVAGRGTDTTRDYVYTNWTTVDAFMHLFVDTIERYQLAQREARNGSLDRRVEDRRA